MHGSDYNQSLTRQFISLMTQQFSSTQCSCWRAAEDTKILQISTCSKFHFEHQNLKKTPTICTFSKSEILTYIHFHAHKALWNIFKKIIYTTNIKLESNYLTCCTPEMHWNKACLPTHICEDKLMQLKWLTVGVKCEFKQQNAVFKDPWREAAT